MSEEQLGVLQVTTLLNAMPFTAMGALGFSVTYYNTILRQRPIQTAAMVPLCLPWPLSG